MIDEFILKFGAGSGRPPLVVTATPVTVFVGPNNSGKSRVLIELENYCRRTHGQPNDLLLEALKFSPYERTEIESELQKIEQTPNPGEVVNPDHVIIGKLNPQNNQAFRAQIHKKGLINEAQNPNMRQGYYGTFLSIYTVRLDGTNRLNLLNEQDAGDLQTTPKNHLAHLFIDNPLRKEVRRIVHDAFAKYFVIDPTNVGKLRVRLSDREPVSEREEKSWENDAIAFHKAAVDIRNASDGVRAFTGIITTILAGDPKVTLIDEPEAFLHPALASKLGNAIAKSLRQTKKRLFVSTHSATFLMGCIQAGVPLNIVRLTYNYSSATARLLPRDKILHLMRHPLLRSTGVLSGLFYESVVVTESDADRAFYQEINERLLAKGDSRGIGSCQFINAQNKQTVWEIVRPLRELGIPAVGVVDIDVIKEGGQVWGKPLDGAFIPEISHQAFHSQRQAILHAFERTGKNMKRDGGIAILQGQEREAAQNLFSQLREYGVFVVQNGELESWLKTLGASNHGPAWLIDVFQKMGENPEDASYVWPTNDDVWGFLGQIKSWIADPLRKGVPA
ncbi:MAG: ATP-binding protein [FCB group bacterium]|jgi:ABC-type cobalamin/Fe3+-siderophores transport system ATPase subunit|nr:ATP-binding protein [FCB group bacterium]